MGRKPFWPTFWSIPCMRVATILCGLSLISLLVLYLIYRKGEQSMEDFIKTRGLIPIFSIPAVLFSVSAVLFWALGFEDLYALLSIA